MVISRKLNLFGHICRMDGNRLVNTVMFGEMIRQPLRGRPHREWLDDIGDWCGENNIQTLVHSALDRKFWSEIVRQCIGHQLGFTLTERLHGTIVGPSGRSDPGYVRLSVRPVGQTGRTNCSRTAHIYQSNQCGLLANYNTVSLQRDWSSDWPVGPTSRT